MAATAFVAARDDRAEPAGAPGAAVTDCTGAQGFAPDGERSLEDAEVFSHLRFSPDGGLLAMHTLEDELSVWDWREDREVARPDVEFSRLGDIAFVPGGCEIATVVMEPEPRPGDEYPTPVGQVLDLVSGTAADHGVRGMAGGPSPGPPPGATGIAVSPEGLIALSGLDAGTRTQIVDGGTGEAVTTFETPGGTLVFLDERRLLLSAFGGSAEEHVTLWDVHTLRTLCTLLARLDPARLTRVGLACPHTRTPPEEPAAHPGRGARTRTQPHPPPAAPPPTPQAPPHRLRHRRQDPARSRGRERPALHVGGLPRRPTPRRDRGRRHPDPKQRRRDRRLHRRCPAHGLRPRHLPAQTRRPLPDLRQGQPPHPVRATGRPALERGPPRPR